MEHNTQGTLQGSLEGLSNIVVSTWPQVVSYSSVELVTYLADIGNPIVRKFKYSNMKSRFSLETFSWGRFQGPETGSDCINRGGNE